MSLHTDVKNMKVAQLKHELRIRNLSDEGKKNELQIRLLEHLSESVDKDQSDYGKFLKLSDFDNFLEGYVEFHKSVSEELFKLKNVKKQQLEHESMMSLEKEIKFLREELESKNVIIDILKKDNETLRQKQVSPTQEYRSTTKNDHVTMNNNHNVLTNNRFAALPVEPTNIESFEIEENTATNQTSSKQKQTRQANRFIDRNPDRNLPSWEINRKHHHNTYADVVTSKKVDRNILIIGDSIIRYINRSRLNRNLRCGKAFVKFFPGATVLQLSHYIIPHLQSNRPESVILHIGTNDIAPRNGNTKSSSEIAQSIQQVAKVCREFGVKNVFVSSITCRSNQVQMKKVIEVNSCLMNMCNEEGYLFIHNSNIELDNLWRDGLHLADSGVDILEYNFFTSLENNLI